MHPHRSHWITALAALFAVGLIEAPVFAQGVSPWLNAVDVLQQAFTGPLARGLSLISIVIGGLMFAFGEGGSKKALAGIIFGLGMAMGAANFLTWLFCMSIGQGARAWAAYPALSAPLTMMGVERRWFLLSATIGMAMWNAINSIAHRRGDLLPSCTPWAGGRGAPTRTC